MIRTEARFVKPDDYFNFFGENLYQKLRAKDNESNKVDIFLMNIEDIMLTKIDKMSFRVDDFNRLTEFQKECLQKAILFQAEYIVRNGNLFTDSGYDPEKGFVADYEKIQNAALCQAAVDKLVICGLINHNIRNRRRYSTLY